jgi:hypothetical protein
MVMHFVCNISDSVILFQYVYSLSLISSLSRKKLSAQELKRKNIVLTFN